MDLSLQSNFSNPSFRCFTEIRVCANFFLSLEMAETTSEMGIHRLDSGVGSGENPNNGVRKVNFRAENDTSPPFESVKEAVSVEVGLYRLGEAFVYISCIFLRLIIMCFHFSKKFVACLMQICVSFSISAY